MSPFTLPDHFDDDIICRFPRQVCANEMTIFHQKYKQCYTQTDIIILTQQFPGEDLILNK